MTRSGLALAVILFATPCLAADAPPGELDYSAPAAPPPPNAVGLVLRLVGLTAVLLLVCGGVMWAARRNNRAALAKGEENGRLRLEGTLALDRNCALHLVRVDELVVAVTTDATGLRSMVVLSESFEAALTAADSPAPETPRAA